MQKKPSFRSVAQKLAVFLALGLALLLAPVGSIFAQTTTPTAGPVEPPAWLKDLPTYNNLEKVELDDATLAALTVLGIDHAKYYINMNLSADELKTIADFYTTKLEALGWQVQRTPIINETLGLQLQFTNPNNPGAQLIVLVASKAALKLAPQFQAFSAKVPDGKNIVAIAAPLSGATTPTTAATEIEPPTWFRFVPAYPKLQKLTLDQKLLSSVGLDPSEVYLQAGLTTDSVATAVDFYTSRLKGAGISSPNKTPLPKDDIGQQLSYNIRGNQLIILIASKQAFGLIPQFKALESIVPSGQTVIALIAPAEAPPVTGTKCEPGKECTVGPYKVVVNFDRTTFNTTDEFVTTIERQDNPGADWKLQAQEVPGNATQATPVKFNGSFESGSSPKRDIKMHFPISGSWYVALTISGNAGDAKLYLPVTVESPPIMDEWLAWLIGLAPLIGIAGFIIGQGRLVLKRRRAERQTGLSSNFEPLVVAGLPRPEPAAKAEETEAEALSR